MNSTISPLGTPNVTLTGQGLRRGARAVFPLLPGMVIFGLLCGVVARQAGLSFIENALMNMFVLAGTAQLASLEQWSYPLPLLSIVVTTLFINLRFLLHGAAAQPWLRSVNPRIVYAMLSVV
ncbi:MAG TPA: AzlC family ABC transporter permease, partial [Thermomicrobiales bacterium]|nr:AzlC family ABC transporter permease [Thermomicrobiales bacterium]